jgi:biotin carboxyl carrier protein
MTLDEIKQLIEFIKGHDLHEFELEQDGVKIRIKSGGNHHQVMAAPHMQASMPMMAPTAMTAPVAASAVAPAAPPAAGDDEGGELAIVKSPIVGTFYRSAEPGAEGVCVGRRHGAQGPGAVHHRSDEVDERDRLRVRRGSHEHLHRERTGRAVR